MAETTQQAVPTPEPKYRAPTVKPYKPRIGEEFITRNIGYVSSRISSKDPHTVSGGADTYKYADVACHPQVALGLNFIVNAPFWTGWRLHVDNDYEKYPAFEVRDGHIIRLIEYQIKKMKYENFENILKQLWKDAIVYGFCIAEMSFRTDGNYICIDKIKPHSPHLFDLYTDDGFELDRIYYKPGGTWITRELLPKFLVGTYPYIIHGNFYGKSRLQSIYFDVQVLQILEQAQAEGCRALAIKPIIHYYVSKNKSDKQLQEIKKSIYNIDSAAMIDLEAIPNVDGQLIYQDELKLLEDRASPAGIALIKDILDVLYKRCNRLLGVPDDLGFSDTVLGSYAKAKEEANLFTLGTVNDQGWIENFANQQIIPAMVRYNYPDYLESDEYNLPEYCSGTVEEEADAVEIQNVIDMFDGGILNKSDPNDIAYARDRLGLPAASIETIEDVEEDEDEEVEEGSVPAKLRKQIVGYMKRLGRR